MIDSTYPPIYTGDGSPCLRVVKHNSEEWTSEKWGKKRHLVQSQADSASEMNMGKAKDMNLEEQWGIPDVCWCNMPTQTLFWEDSYYVISCLHWYKLDKELSS